MKLPVSCVLTFIAATTITPARAAESPAATAASLIAKNQDALVGIEANLKLQVELVDGPPGIADMLSQAPEQEQESKAAGVVIHSSGLIAAPIALLDPCVAIGEMEVDSPLGKLKLAPKSPIARLRVITGNGQEYPADIILRNEASGLALIKLTTPPEGAMKAVELTKEIPAPQPFSRIFDLVRLNGDFGRVPSVRQLRFVQSTLPPSPLYEISGEEADLGSAGFDAEGHFLGITVLPIRAKLGDGASSEEAMLLPASEILRLGAKVIP